MAEGGVKTRILSLQSCLDSQNYKQNHHQHQYVRRTSIVQADYVNKFQLKQENRRKNVSTMEETYKFFPEPTLSNNADLITTAFWKNTEKQPCQKTNNVQVVGDLKNLITDPNRRLSYIMQERERTKLRQLEEIKRLEIGSNRCQTYDINREYENSDDLDIGSTDYGDDDIFEDDSGKGDQESGIGKTPSTKNILEIEKNSVNTNSSFSTPLPSTSQADLTGNLSHFSHFDIQSVFFSYNATKSILKTLHSSLNIKTGASAASRQISVDTLSTNSNTLLVFPLSQQINQRLSEYIKSSTSSSMTNSSLFQVDKSSFHMNLEDRNGNERKFLASPLSTRKNNARFDFYVKNKNAHKTNENLNGSTCSSLSITSSNLVEQCPCFRTEIGGDAFKGLGLVQHVSQRRMMKLNSVSILDRINLHYKKEIIDLIEANNNEPFALEYQDWGAYFYRHFFSNQDHSNYIGIDENIGPVAISIRREKLINEPLVRSNSSNSHYGSEHSHDKNYDYVYRFIMRTSDVIFLVLFFL